MSAQHVRDHLTAHPDHSHLFLPGPLVLAACEEAKGEDATALAAVARAAGEKVMQVPRGHLEKILGITTPHPTATPKSERQKIES